MQKEEEMLERSTTDRIVLEPGTENPIEEIAVYRWGEGRRKILMIHGWGGRATQFFAFILRFVESGFEVIAFDAPAHGKSGGEFASGPAFARAAQEVVTRYGPIELVLCHSLGAMATVIALTNGLKADRVALLSPLAFIEPSLETFSEAKGLSTAQKSIFFEEFYDRYSNVVLKAPTAVKNFNIPCLIVHDPADTEVPIEHSRMIAASWKGSLLHEQGGVGHWRILRAQEVVEKILRFAL
jgi:pimeloyl-ACP methyl ester carboxylesterase